MFNTSPPSTAIPLPPDTDPSSSFMTPFMSPLPAQPDHGTSLETSVKSNHRQAARAARRGKSARRPGVILLMMVVILVLFSLVCVTWVITARQYSEMSSSAAAHERYDSGFEGLLNEAMMQVIRGSTNPYSAMGPHSLLEDKYGNDAVLVSLGVGQIKDGAQQPQLTAANQLTLFVYEDTSMLLSPLNDYYNGRILTFTRAPASPGVVGISRRILDYSVDPNNNDRTFIIESFPTSVFAPTPPLPSHYLQGPSEFVINGREFNGRGFTDPFIAGQPFPANPAGDVPEAVARGPMGYDTAGGYNSLGADESYDAPDWNNMILSGRVWDDTQQRWRTLIPSMHRPAYLNFAVEAGAVGADARSFMFRPSTDPANGNPNFGLNNQQLSMALDTLFNSGNGVAGALTTFPDLIAYDVDNDGDGEADSVWIDLGFPAQTAADGRMYRPLFALLVQDMDSRLNVNHHGTQEHAFEQNASAIAYRDTHTTGALPVPAPGLGEGPADVTLQTYLTTFETTNPYGMASYWRLLYGDGNSNEGRYGELHRSGLLDYELPAPGLTNVHDPLSAILNHDYRNWRRRYGTPPDARAYDRVGVTVDGQLRHSALGAAGLLYNPQVDNPYEFNASLTRKLFGGGAGLMYEDRPFSAGELELLLRYADADVKHSIGGGPSPPYGLEDRLVNLLSLSLDTTTPQGRRVQGDLTTHSADSSAPNIRYTPDMEAAASMDTDLQALMDEAPSPSIVDLVRFRIFQADNSLSPAALNQLTNDTIFNLQYGYFLSPDLLGGTRMDINRPFGNGRDDLDVTNGQYNGVIDEGHNANMGDRPNSPYYDPANPAMPPTPEPGLIGEAALYNVEQPAWELQAEYLDMTTGSIVYNYNYNGYYFPPGNPYPQYSVVMQDVNYNGVPQGPADDKEFLARHYYARHLYCLMMLLKSPDTGGLVQPFEFAAALPSENEPEFTAYRLAQWAINCVDYMDRDSIMSAFEYDARPFVDDDGDLSNGTWDVDGDITTVETDMAGMPLASRRVIWGMERPTMILDETLAFHDVRTEDTDQDDGDAEYTLGHTPQPAPGTEDDDFDQTRVPQGSLFFELYCAVNGVVPAELRPETFTPWGNQRVPENVVDLSRLAPPGMDDTNTAENETYRRPVWRMVVAARNNQISVPNSTDPIDSLRPSVAPAQPLQAPGTSLQPLESPDDMDISRIVWFTSWDAYMQQTGVDPETVDTRIYYSDLQLANANAAPDQQDFGNVVNWGFDDPATREAAMRMFHVAPAQYAVVGPRVTTKIGHSFPDAFDPMGPVQDKPNETVIQLLDPNLAPDAIGNDRPIVPFSDSATADPANGIGIGMFIDRSVPASPDYNASYKSPDWTNSNNANPPGAEEQDRLARRPVGIVINGPRVAGVTGRRSHRGLSISEPAPNDPYYDQPDGTPAMFTIDTYDTYLTPKDVPEDDNSSIPLVIAKKNQADGGVDSGPGINGSFADIYEDGTGPKSLFLQRLANPLAPYHARYNPYITMDVMDLDLSVYNGEEPLDHQDQIDNPPEIRMSRQKTGELYNPNTNSLTQEFSIWGSAADVDYPPVAINMPVARANREALHSLGHVNGLYSASVNPADLPQNDHFLVSATPALTTEDSTAGPRLAHGAGLAEHIALTLTAENHPVPTAMVPSDRVGSLQNDPVYLNSLALALEQTISNTQEWTTANGVLTLPVPPPANETGPGGIFIGYANDPMSGTMPPSLAWNDRPYISAMDLMNVPATSADRFSRDFSIRSTAADMYNGDSMQNNASFRHLLNFFQVSSPGPGFSFSNFHQLFEYVHVPSKFPDSQKLLTPALTPAAGGPVNYGPYMFGGGIASVPLYPPFNKISQYHEQGKLNMNDVFDAGDILGSAVNDRRDPMSNRFVYNGGQDLANPNDAAFNAWRQSRRGGAAVVPLSPELDLELNPALPSFFHNPFQGFSTPDIHRTYLRQDPNAGAQPLLAARTPTDPGPQRLGSNPNGGTIPPERDGDRSSYFRYEPLNKLGNIATTRSNVYAVWITVGFFEVIPDAGVSRDLFPDGMRLGRELGLDDGNIIRHRMFGIIDRTRPSAFVRGVDLNARDTILLQRVIE